MPSINVTVLDSTENKRHPVELPDDAPIEKLIQVLVDKMKLPKTAADGSSVQVYQFHHKNSGRLLQDKQTLAQAGVKNGDILRLAPVMIAG